MIATKLMSGSLKDCLDEENKSEKLFFDMYHESTEMYEDHWSSRLDGSESQLKMFLFFSMHQFQKEATDITLPNTFGLDYQYLILKYFWEKVKFTAEYEEAKGNTLIIFSIGSEDNLIQQFNQYNRYKFWNYMGNNQDSREYWTTKLIILDLLSHKDKIFTDWLAQIQNFATLWKHF